MKTSKKSERRYNSFADFFAEGQYELKRDVEVAIHNDENIANNRLFVWNFEEVDLEEYLEYFKIYKSTQINVASRQNLSGNLMRKMNAMIREGYNPVECMLYASKIINMRLRNDTELQIILGERIKDVYIKQSAETISVLENIMDMWTWAPQIKVVITAIGLIGDNQELLDKMMINYAEDPSYKKKVFYALLENKSLVNLERILKIIMNLQDNEEDNAIGRAFTKEITYFGYEGIKMIAKYYENPAISRIGTRVLKRIMLKEGVISDPNGDDELYRKNLANKSAKDDLAFKDFREECYERYDDDAFFLARFSRVEIGEFLKDAIEDKKLTDTQRDTAIISLGIIGGKGYQPAEAILDKCEKRGCNEYAVTIAKVILGDKAYAQKLAQYMSVSKDYELSDLYRVIRASGIVNSPSVKKLVQDALEDEFINLLEKRDYQKLEYLTGNFQMFHDKKLWAFLSWNMLEDMREVLMIYSKNGTDLPTSIAISLIETVVPNWSNDVEKTIFTLYKNSDNSKVRELSYKKLKERKIEAPK